ncbi:MAG TPA: hypothetical protein VKD72_28860 [Gemmataceae bacterium]|nr:hypothetical protein [Gemmataceae bacterium]
MRAEIEIRLTARELVAIRACVEQTLAQMEMDGTPDSEHSAALRRALIKLRRNGG